MELGGLDMEKKKNIRPIAFHRVCVAGLESALSLWRRSGLAEISGEIPSLAYCPMRKDQATQATRTVVTN